jgi:CheY-like chemotaxis protein
MLGELGHKVVRARTGAEALQHAAENAFDVVFTDVVMPGMSGLELAERLRELQPSLPIVLTTGYSDEVSTSGTGGLPVVFKPYRVDTLTDVLDTVLRADSR